VELLPDDSPEAWIAKALFACGEPPYKRSKSRQSPLDIIQQAIAALPTEEMYRQAIRFVKTCEIDSTKSDELLDTLFQQAIRDCSSVTLALEYADHLENDEQAVEMLKTVCQSSDDARVWIRLATLSEEPVAVLERALRVISIDSWDHLAALLRMTHTKMEEKVSLEELLKLLQRVLLLSAGRTFGHTEFGVESILDTCVRSLEYAFRSQNLFGARKVCNLVLFHSNALQAAAEETAKAFVDKAIAMEQQCEDISERKTRLARIYETAIETFSGSVADEYREQRDEVRLGLRHTGAPSPRFHSLISEETKSTNFGIPVLDSSCLDVSAQNIWEEFDRYQIVHLKGMAKPAGFSWKSMGELFSSLDESDRSSWCIESGKSISLEMFLRPEATKQ
jgi:hypothetical protein